MERRTPVGMGQDKNGLLLRLLAISAVIFISTAVVSHSLRSLQEKSLRALWEKNNQLEVADQECVRRLNEAEDLFKMKLQDKIDGMQKLLERESQRCQDLMNDQSKSSNSSSRSSDDGTGSSNLSTKLKGLESIIKRQNEMLENYREKVLNLEAKLKNQ